MSTDEQDQTAVPDGIHDTGDLGRLWDALEHLAGKVDAAAPDPAIDEEGPPPAVP
ncbi:hypothetical protein [Agrococcus jejuensis]|uniref:Uncharacterized protein n=1 Tax=Agrococcus jejuensis TaxID=399736 RepID=A0A1G8CUN4_9MICO|nr:hypothetical protein [Agrococcus jejuensis]SDH49237.1 hypothetical protein SAMN04489720_1417 [Agrococcus jejuensis]